MMAHIMEANVNEAGQDLDPVPEGPRVDRRPDEVPDDTIVAKALKLFKEDQVQVLVNQLKSLAASDAGEKILLITMDSLVDLASEANHPELHFFQDLRAHCLRVRDLVPVASVILEVLATKQEDKMWLIVQNLCKEYKLEETSAMAQRQAKVTGSSAQDVEVLSGANFGSKKQFKPMMPFPQYGWQSYPFHMPPTYFPGAQLDFQGSQFLQQGVRPFTKRKCYICGLLGHISEDCVEPVMHTK